MGGKRLEDLNLRNEPLPPTGSPADLRDTVWYEFLTYIDSLLADGRCNFAEETLRGIQASVRKYQTVTKGQREAVANIEDGAYRHRARSGRRWEGFER